VAVTVTAAVTVGRAQASSGQVVIAVAAGTKLEIARQADGGPWQVEKVASGRYGQGLVAG
jgi:hypothetical protein